jgi:hypothetical protein
MTRVHSLLIGLVVSGTLTRNQALAQSVGAPPAPPVAPAPAQPAPPAAAVPTSVPGEAPPPGWAAPPGYGPGPNDKWRFASAPMEMRFIEGKPIPPGYHLETRARRGLVVSGPIIFGVPYVLSMSVAASSRYEPDRWLYAPVFGPFVNLAQRKDDCAVNSVSIGSSATVSCSGDSATRFFLMFDGLMQTAGATMLILGLALPQRVLVRDDAPYYSSSRSHFAWAVAPQAMGRSGYGLSLAGIF